jgi:hypothetical protein
MLFPFPYCHNHGRKKNKLDEFMKRGDTQVMDGWMDGWMDGCVGGWMNGCGSDI